MAAASFFELEMDEKLYSELVILFETDMDAAMRECERKLTGTNYLSFESFLKRLKETLKCNVCQRSWGQKSLAGHCLDCQVKENSCICIPCFIAGNHAGHRAFVIAEGSGNCDCGDSCFWKKSGFCPNHTGPDENPDISGLPANLRTLFITIFSACLNNFGYLALHDVNGFGDMWNWFQVFIPIGDAVRRCVTIALKSVIERPDFALVLASMPPENMERLIESFGGLVNDVVFAKSFGAAVVKSYPKWIWMMTKAVRDDNVAMQKTMSMFTDFAFHAFTSSAITGLLESGWDWVNVFNEILAVIVGMYRREPAKSFVESAKLTLHLTYLDDLLNVAGSMEGQKKNISRCAVCFVEQLSEVEGFLSFVRETGAKKNSHIHEYTANNSLTYMMAMIAQTFYRLNAYDEKVIGILYGVLRHLLLENRLDGKDAKGSVMSRCPIDPHVRTSPQIVVSMFVANLLLSQKDDIIPSLNRACIELGIRVDELCEVWATLLNRWLASVCLYHNDFFVRNTEDLHIRLLSVYWKRNLDLKVVPLFAALQVLYGATKQKGLFLENFARVMGVIPRRPEWPATLDFAFLHFIGCLVFDRYAITRDMKNIRRSQAVTLLQQGPQTVDSIRSTIGLGLIDGFEFTNELLSFTTRISSDNGSLFKVTASDWNVFVPYISRDTIINIVSDFVSKHRDRMLYLPDLEDDPYGLDLRSGLLTPVVCGLEWYVLFEKGHKGDDEYDVVLLIVLALMITASKVSESSKKKPREIKAQNIEELIRKIPDNFFEFLYTPVRYESNRPYSAFELLQQCGRIGHDALSRMNIGYEAPKVSHQVLQKEKSNVATLKQSIMQDFRARSAAFMDAAEVDADVEGSCCICRDHGGEMGYPVMVFPSSLAKSVSDEFQTKGAVGINVCSHVVHFNCVQTCPFRCQIDRKLRNSLLPQLPERRASKEMMQRIATFTNTAFKSGMDCAVATFATELGLLELRHRSRPECMDNPSNGILLRNLFHVIWIWYHQSPAPLNFTDPFGAFVAKLVMSPNPDESFKEFVTLLGEEEMAPEKLYECLRRAALFQHFVLNQYLSDQACIDWDELLSFPALLERYDIRAHARDIELAPFSLMKLPNSFLLFLMPPYSYDILDTSTGIAVCLLTSTVVCLSGSTDHPNINDHLRQHCNGGAAPFLVLTGEHATSVVIASPNYGAVQAKPLYVDPCGDPDIGLKLGKILTLNLDRYYQLHDMFLSGDWLSQINPN